jgi:choline transport protein
VFPPELPVTGNNMNYAIVAFGIIVVIATVQWIFDGRKNYKGPQLDEIALMHGVVEGITGAEAESSNVTDEEVRKSE